MAVGVKIRIDGVQLNGTWSAGSVATITVTNGGSGYTGVPTVTITAPASPGVTATATAVVTSQAVSSVTINTAGSNYHVAPTVSFSGGGGSGAAATATISGQSLYVPLQDIATDWSGGLVVPQANKIGTDPSFDVSTTLIAYPLVRDFSAGAWKKDHDKSARRYYTPSVSGTGDTMTNGPLPWTTRPDAPIMCGAGWTESNGTYSFKEIDEYKGSLYAIDFVGGHVRKLTAPSTWGAALTDGLTKAPTELYVRTLNGADRTLIVGQGANGDGSVARQFDGSTWSAFNPAAAGFTGNAQHFEYIDNTLWFTTGNQLVENRATAPRKPRIGDNSTAITNILWIDKVILAAKPEGIFVHDPAQSGTYVRPLIHATKNDAMNGQLLLLHNGMAWFNFNNRLYAYKNGVLMDRTFAIFEGATTRAFYTGAVIGGYSSGDRLFVWLKVPTATTYDYYLCVYTGDSGGFHPIFYVTSTVNPTLEPHAVCLFGNNLHYSISNDGSANAKTGWLYTDGYVPMGDGTTSYTRNVALTTGWVDFDRDAIVKWFKELRVNVKDQGTTGGVTLHFKKWGDSAWTLIGSTTAGSQEQNVVTIPNDLGSQAGITGTKVNFKVTMINSSATPASAWFVDSIHLFGLPVYTPAYHVTIRAWGRENLQESGLVKATVLVDALKGAISQNTPVTLYHPDGSTYVGHCRPIPGHTDVLITYDRNELKMKERQFIFGFSEDK